MSPEMVDMMKGMGITEDQIKDTVSNMPKDFDIFSIMGDMSDKMKDGQEEIRNKMMPWPPLGGLPYQDLLIHP
jgi:hypothetical protein